MRPKLVAALSSGAGLTPAPVDREEPEAFEIRKGGGTPLEHVAERVAPRVSVGLGVRSGADAQTVAHHDDDAAGHGGRETENGKRKTDEGPGAMVRGNRVVSRFPFPVFRPRV